MIDNDARTRRYGLSLGDEVDFRWNGARLRGTVIRLTLTKAVIKTAAADSKTVLYRQVEQSNRYPT
jgi:hypothetical protein